MNIGMHHFLRKYGKIDQTLEATPVVENRDFRHVINKGVYAIGIFGVIVIIPQIIKIWVDRDFGVSLPTWIGFLIGASFWFCYGLVHKEKPIIFTNLAVMIADLMVISGLLLLR